MNLWGIFYFSYLNTVNFIINKTPFYKFHYLNISISFQPGKEKAFCIFQMEWSVRTMLKQNYTRELVANMLEGLKEQNEIEVSAQTQNSWLFLNRHCQGAGTQSLSHSCWVCRPWSPQSHWFCRTYHGCCSYLPPTHTAQYTGHPTITYTLLTALTPSRWWLHGQRRNHSWVRWLWSS